MRLEFQAAIMATCFKVFSLEEIKENILKVLLWIDSKTILSYLRNEDRSFGIFVAQDTQENTQSHNI